MYPQRESFHNTTNESGATLVKSESAAKSQEENIYKYFHASPHHKYTAEDVWRNVYPDQKTPLTSVRRAMSNLTEEKKLYRTGEFVIGMYGKKISLYKLRTDNFPQTTLFQ